MQKQINNLKTKPNPPAGEGDYYKQCPGCSNFSHIDENQIFCAVCGEKLIEACPECGEKIKNPTAKYCVKCGGELVKVQTIKKI